MILPLRQLLAKTNQIILSNNGTILISANKDPQTSPNIDQSENVFYFTNYNFKWKFSLLVVPWMCSVSKAMVKLTKLVLLTIISTTTIQEDLLMKLFCEFQKILNSRLLFQLRENLTYFHAINGNHFICKSFNNSCCSKFVDSNINDKKQWKSC